MVQLLVTRPHILPTRLLLALTVGLLVTCPCPGREPTDPNRNLIANGRFVAGTVGQLPSGWSLVAPNPALAPVFKLAADEGGRQQLVAQGNGRDECFGYLWHPVQLSGGKTYRFRVRFRFEELEDVNRHLLHGVFVPKGFNDGIFTYRRDGDWVVGERVFPGPEQSAEAEVRLYFRYSPRGRVWWEEVSLEEVEPIPPRLVKIAVSWGWGDRDHWTRWLDAAGQKSVDIALLPEFFNQPDSKAPAPPPEAIDGPAATLMATKAKQWRMLVAGTFRLQREDLVYNSAPLFDRQGALIGIYDKNMLYDPELDQGTSPGVGFPVFQTDFGRVGIMTCYDSWFPEPARLMGYKGAELLLFPSAGYYAQLMYARAADNGLAIAASSLNSPAGVWDSGGNQAGEKEPDSTRYAPTSIVDSQRDEEHRMLVATLDLSLSPSPHWWGGPMLSAPAARRVRQTWRVPLEEEIAREARRWHEPEKPIAENLTAD